MHTWGAQPGRHAVDDRFDDLRVRLDRHDPAVDFVHEQTEGVENAVKKAVCAGQATLSAAQDAMLTNWTTAKSVLGIG